MLIEEFLADPKNRELVAQQMERSLWVVLSKQIAAALKEANEKWEKDHPCGR